MNIVNNSLIIFGGIGADGHQFNDIWIYNLVERYWIQPQTIFQIPPIAFHVAIIVDQQWLYIHGGRFENSSISSNIYRINLLSSLNNQWESLNKGRKLAAHTAIFYNRSILIFGGIDMNNNQLQNTLYQYNVDDNYWSIIRYRYHDQNLIPRKRALHSMLLLDNDYLMIFGGFIENDCDNKDDDDGTKIYLFSLKYRYWTMYDDHNQFPFKSISSHTMIRRKNFLFIFGGYYGQIRDEILVTKINHSIYDDHGHQNSSESTICKYFNVPNISMPDEMIIEKQRSTIFHSEQMIRIFGFIHHPLGSQTFDNNILRIYLRNGNNDNNLLNSTFDLSFVNNNFIDHIIRLPIRTIMMKRLDFDHHHYHNVFKRETKCAIGTYEDNSVVGNGRCLPCDCNGHGDHERGICHPKNGYCFCRNNTEGSNCNRCSTGYYGQPKNGGICFEQCQNKALILNATFGYFGSYQRSYVSKMKKIESSSTINHHHCMWIISTGPDYHSLRNQPSLQITIFKLWKLNCSHSTLIIYDGVPDFILQNQKSLSNQYRILASICGQQQQSNDLKLIANTGIATILYKTDYNFEQQQGFNASYQSMENNSSSNDAKWPQNSHQLEYFNNHLIFIGGHIHTLNLCLTLYSFDDDRWIQLDNQNGKNFPTNRYLHASTMIDDKLYVYGGVDLHTNQVLVEFWSASFIFDHDQNNLIKWINLTAADSKPPPLIGHTLTGIQLGQSKQDALILIGGYSPQNGYSSNQYVYLMKENQWILLKTKGSSPLGIIGHSTVYHHESGKIFIFGGLDFKESHKWAISNTIYQLDFHHSNPNNQFIWHRIQPRSVLNSIIPLYLHQAFTLPNYMLIFGGKKVINYRGSGGGGDRMMANNHDDPISYAYFYKCNRWIAIQNVSSSSWSNVSILNNRHRHSIQGSSWSITIDNQRILYRYESSSATTKNQPWSIEKIQLPKDFCEFFSNDQTQCLSTNGCSYCRRNSSSSTSGICFDQSLAAAVKFDCFEILNETSVGCINGRKECNQFTNCVDCTTVNYEFQDDNGGGCQWCADCHMANGHCIKMNDTCQQWDDDDNDHSYHNNEFVTSIGIGTGTGSTTICQNISIIEMKHCSTRRCLATDCQHCLLINQERRLSLSLSSLSFNHQIGDDNGCIWTKQVYKFIRFGHHLAMPTNPIFDWACIESSIIRFSVMKNVPTIPPLKCPKRCSQYYSCQSCLEETFGDESGSHECLWSELTGECMSSIYSTIKCQQNHQCGGFIYRLQPNDDDDHQHQCPAECETFEKANDCLSMLHCGWCAVDGLPIDGVGFCLQGDLQGPKYRHCSNQSIDLLSQLKHKSYYVPMKLWKTSWYYLKSPNENECLNGHHNCNQKSQICIDLIDGFMCQCKNGYRMFNDNGVVVCKPICQQGCLNGQCIEPNICQCNFGYIGHDCSIECQCNGHSLCPSSDRRYECIHCENNTQGKSCEQCKPFFIGNPTKPGEKCQSCSEFCHNHSELCFSQEDLSNLTTTELNEFNDTQWFKFGMEIIRHGPISPAITKCINCKNNTDGNQCEHCKLGYFKISDNIHDGCRQCMCNNHGSLCNPFNGENCDCHNNTENDRQCNYLTTKEYSNYINKTYYFKSSQIMTTYSLPCWMLQCTKCKDYFYGQPSNGHQCYRHMFLDKEYCLNSIRQENCIIDQQQQQQQNPEQNQLLLGRTIFFAIQPRYMNVDLKLIIFNVDGMIDLYMASKEDIFIIQNDPLNGFHQIFIDKKYIDYDQNESSTIDHVEIDKLIDFNNSSSKSSDQTSTIKSPYKMTLINLNELSSESSYFTMKNWYEIFIVKNVQNRLEITIPYRYHDLRTTRYYLMIYGSFLNDTDGDFIDKNQANIVVRQDQSRIDLFIFFCVFISCFFLFLSMSIMFWRLKQIIFIHHTRQLQQMELQLMANRPMATITILLDNDNDDNNDKRYLDDSESLIGFRPYNQESITPPSSSSKQRHRTIFHQLTANFKESPKKIYPEYSRTMINKQEQSIMNNRKRPSPRMPLVSLEPTFDGSAAILTTFIQFPHKKDNNDDNSNQSLQMAAASTLISLLLPRK
ncbi:multiple EGF like domains 8 [Dermatophagoides pteronyssinus]|uniref:multiple EGF like domains 8 n=1 Tax=Dermatophagoides pteronyssinus TaxID=6956 RepID=UPI003F67EC7D